MVTKPVKKNKRTKKMTKVGDRVRITLEGPGVLAGTASTSGYTTILGDNPVTLTGKIIREEQYNWVIALDNQYQGRNQIIVPKATVS